MQGKPLRVTILGSGTSTGVPVIGCRCAVCQSPHPRNKRSRASILLTLADGGHIVIDTGPEFRLQMLSAGVCRLQHVVYTHPHADHTHGFDDLRAFYFHHRQPVTCYVAAEHEAEFRSRFAYAFEATGYLGTKPQVVLKSFAEQTFEVAGLDFEPLMLAHGDIRTAAFRLGSFAYATDFKAFPESSLAAWKGRIKLMIASGVHFGPHRTHSTIPETLALFAALEVEQGFITHLAHEVDYERDSAGLPTNVALAYDGMAIDVIV